MELSDNEKRREVILKNIRQLAKENNKTPSEKTFREHFDIGPYELKKYGWAYYGELVREAGLTPNKFDKTKYSHQQLRDIFVGMIREKGKWPTRGDLDVKQFRDPAFPSSATFYKKLGLTGQLAQTILDYVEDKKGYNDIVDICRSVLKGHEDKTREGDQEKIGYVYLGLQAGKHKIGLTKDLDRRREDITLLGPAPMKWIHAIKTDDMRGVEKYWHSRFKDKRLRGEWFKLSPGDVRAFKRWKNIY
jgi:hypothetical protein